MTRKIIITLVYFLLLCTSLSAKKGTFLVLFETGFSSSGLKGNGKKHFETTGGFASLTQNFSHELLPMVGLKSEYMLGNQLSVFSGIQYYRHGHQYREQVVAEDKLNGGYYRTDYLQKVLISNLALPIGVAWKTNWEKINFQLGMGTRVAYALRARYMDFYSLEHDIPSRSVPLRRREWSILGQGSYYNPLAMQGMCFLRVMPSQKISLTLAAHWGRYVQSAPNEISFRNNDFSLLISYRLAKYTRERIVRRK